MSELSCDTPFIGRNETHDLSRYLIKGWVNPSAVGNVEPYASARRWVNFTQKVGKFYPDTHPALMSVSKSLF